MRIFYLFLLLGLGACGNLSVLNSSQEVGKAPKIFKETFGAMGTYFEISLVTKTLGEARKGFEVAENEVLRVEQLISSWDENSQTSSINQSAGNRAIKVDQELYDLIQKCIDISELTDGAFDISFASINQVWRFDGTLEKLPSPEIITSSISKINYQNIILNPTETSVFLKEEGMKIGFGAIGKGYAAQCAKEVLQQAGFKNGIVNAGGDLIGWGRKPNNKFWTIGIANPGDPDHFLAQLPLKNAGIVTSGDAEKFVIIDGKKYAHIIDPRTGYPAEGLKSVSILCDDATLADALATAVFVLGKEQGLNLVKRLKGVETFMVDEEGVNIFTKKFKPLSKNSPKPY